MFGAVFLPSLKLGSITVFWSVLAFAGIWFGIARRVKVLRIVALLLLGGTTAKLLALDTAHLATAARVAVFSLTGILLIVGAFLYIRFKERFETHE
jgi:predicted membrane channel-forming protein YqfA (hemolysin III family)